MFLTGSIISIPSNRRHQLSVALVLIFATRKSLRAHYLSVLN